MLAVLLMTMLSLVVGGLVLAYVAYPHRGQDVPFVPQLGEAMRRGVDRLPLLSEDEEPLLRRR
ncbi:hypothetical protein [Nocardioides daphniae]|uniref:Uncharacterized protein n=1 Tax=Nocardioides daphniae TaxID=402297 RepID=A0A4P7UA19_9ACTN|nr:hypothetical protein [Nocardioides daphniae]QCC76900.1 hypothetical protein E2C04_06115 [Nocardioides daphniae]GGD17547.1 hypothetical protein GCM10007231_15680 [Nocardioides daphniae]